MFVSAHRGLLDRLYDRSAGRCWNLRIDRFDRALFESARHALGLPLPTIPLPEYLESLHVSDLALATACLEGCAAAWEHLVEAYDARIRRAAHAIERRSSWAASELAGSVYAELYGIDERGNQRQPRLLYFHGRSGLATWVRAVLVQRYLDAQRCESRHRLVAPLDVAPSHDTSLVRDPEPRLEGYRSIARVALRAALATLPLRDRQRFGYYYRDRLPLTAVARRLNEHASTVSRQLACTRKKIRQAVELVLCRTRLAASERSLCFECLQDPEIFTELMRGLRLSSDGTGLGDRPARGRLRKPGAGRSF